MDRARLQLLHMNDWAHEARSLLADNSREAFLRDRQLVLASACLLTMIGRAAGRVPPDLRARHKQTHWDGLIDVACALIRDYATVDYGRVWETVVDDLPVLISDLEAILGTEPEDTE